MHSNEDDNPLYLFIQLKPYTHTFGRKMHVVETSIHMSFLTTFQREVTGGFNYSVNNGKWDICPCSRQFC